MPEPRGEIVDTAAADDNHAVLVDGELRAGSQLLTEQVTINGTTFDYQVDANGFWQVHRQAPIALGRTRSTWSTGSCSQRWTP